MNNITQSYSIILTLIISEKIVPLKFSLFLKLKLKNLFHPKSYIKFTPNQLLRYVCVIKNGWKYPDVF